MLRLMLLRHAESARPVGIGDHERPLAADGRAQSPWVGRYMAAESLLPDLVLVSTARRTEETWELVRPSFELEVRHRHAPQLYEASGAALLATIRQLGGEVRTVLLVGHNPGLQDLAVGLIGRADGSELARLRRKLPTAALVVIDFAAGSWDEVAPGAGRLARFVAPPPMPVASERCGARGGG